MAFKVRGLGLEDFVGFGVEFLLVFSELEALKGYRVL